MSGETVKLTKQRRDMLEQLKREPGSYSASYAPLKWLVENGYAEVRDGRYTEVFRITPAGRAALASSNTEER